MGQSGLFQHGIGEVARKNFAINWKAFPANRALPYFVITLALPNGVTSSFTQKPFEFRREIVHAARVLTTPVL